MSETTDHECHERLLGLLPRLPDQPGDTLTYKARIAGREVLTAVSGLTPWAKSQVLQWALDMVRSETA